MLADDLEKVLDCEVERGKPMTQLTTLGVGGRVECYLELDNQEDILALFALWRQEGFPLYIIGDGSNIVAADGLISGVVLSTRRLGKVSWEENIVSVQAGCPLASLVGGAAGRDMSGLEFAFGIPGTVGGALSGNAGAGGKGVCGLLTEVTTLEADGSLRRWEREEFSSSYRHFSLTRKDRFFLECRLELQPGRSEEIKAEQMRFWNLRISQPLEDRSAGCSFKNPQGNSAGRMLDQCGCKGLSVGGAAVSRRHANFIVNRGDATAADVIALLRLCRDRVFEDFGVWLEPELRFLGFEPFPEGEGRVCATES
ncbi:MAG: UDP-N-acetylmuramate dehydrogenase [Synergistaceae bacterium]|nr:UDP-N-acetylmuramate dehydrogenase [Synergistaceae bacterium]